MTAAAPKTPLDYAAYLAVEQKTGLKHMFWDGEVFAMTGAMPDHNVIAANLTVATGLALRGAPCRPYTSDQRIRVSDDRAFYPDLTIVCGERHTHADDPGAVTNPTAVFEVISPSTEAFDRGQKFEAMASLPSLRTYVLIAQDRPGIQIFERSGPDAEWTVRVVTGGTLAIRSLDVGISVAELYDGTDVSVD